LPEETGELGETPANPQNLFQNTKSRADGPGLSVTAKQLVLMAVGVLGAGLLGAFAAFGMLFGAAVGGLVFLIVALVVTTFHVIAASRFLFAAGVIQGARGGVHRQGGTGSDGANQKKAKHDIFQHEKFSFTLENAVTDEVRSETTALQFRRTPNSRCRPESSLK
jgi:hypothetical protein